MTTREDCNQLYKEGIEQAKTIIRLRAALEAVRNEIQQAQDADQALFWKLGLDESEKWDQPSRNLQTFSYVLQEIENALNPKP